jgi:hypothetical protein
MAGDGEEVLLEYVHTMEGAWIVKVERSRCPSRRRKDVQRAYRAVAEMYRTAARSREKEV